MKEALTKYNEVFKTNFNVDDEQLHELVYKAYPEWNSMAHIALISALEDEFGICFEAEDIFALTSYETGKAVMKARFDIEL